MTTTLRKPETDAEAEATPREYHWTVEIYHRAGDAGVFDPDVKLELLRGRIIDRYAEAGPTDYHWTADAFDSACDAGVFGPEARLELIHGRIIGTGWRRVLYTFGGVCGSAAPAGRSGAALFDCGWSPDTHRL